MTKKQKAPREHRRSWHRYFFGSHLQWKFGTIVFLFLVAVGFFVGLRGFFALQDMIARGVVVGDGAIAQLRLLTGIVNRTFVVGLVITFFLALFFSHFVAGPIYRFRRVLEEIKEGKLNIQVNLRKFDELQDVAVMFNEALSSLRHRLRHERSAVDEATEKAEKLAGKLRKAGRTSDATELEELVSSIRDNARQIQL